MRSYARYLTVLLAILGAAAFVGASPATAASGEGDVAAPAVERGGPTARMQLASAEVERPRARASRPSSGASRPSARASRSSGEASRPSTRAVRPSTRGSRSSGEASRPSVRGSGSSARPARPAVRSDGVGARATRPAVPRDGVGARPPHRERALPPRVRPPRHVIVHPPRGPFFFGPSYYHFYYWRFHAFHPPVWYGGYYPHYAPGPRYWRTPGEGRGAVDCAVRPRAAEIWVEGEQIGRCQDFDGRPNYLWLRDGIYQMAFYHPGYETWVAEVRVRDGHLERVGKRLRRGEAVPPSQLLGWNEAGYDAPSPRDVRLQQRRDRGERVAGDPDWRERARQQRRALHEELGPGEEAEPYENGARETERRARPEPAPEPERELAAALGTLRLEVEPADASVYLDGRFLGTGADLAGMEAGVDAPPGERRIEVVRPGYRPETVTLELAAGEARELTVELQPN